MAAFPTMGPVASVIMLAGLCLSAPFYPVLAAHCRAFVPLSRAGRAISCINLLGLTCVFAVQAFTGFVVEATAAEDGTGTVFGYRLVFAIVALTLALSLAGYLRVEDAPP
jgi:hypothetical protein